MNHVAIETVMHAPLPQVYQRAQTALAECTNLDECKAWADKAAALASYARQADDESLMKMATRIRGRAIRRVGELLEQINGRGTRTDQLSVADDTKLTQRQAAADAGLSKRQQVQAVRVARIPGDDFERQVESDKPPTLSQLAQQGIQRPQPRPLVDLQGRDPRDFNRAMHFVGEFEHVARNLAAQDLDGCLPILDGGERARLRTAVAAIDAVTDAVATRI